MSHTKTKRKKPIKPKQFSRSRVNESIQHAIELIEANELAEFGGRETTGLLIRREAMRKLAIKVNAILRDT